MAPEGNVLALVARYPRPGTVKTRLAADLGVEPAHALYCAFLRDLAERLADGPWQVHWLFTPADAPFAAWLGPGCSATPQCGPSLNLRLLNGFRSLRGRYERVMIMSTDSPQVAPDWVARGFALLDRHDVVLGPCDDGGYYLVGMRASRDIFSGITMSTPTVLEETLALARRRGLSTALLQRTFDVDDLAGLTALRHWLAGHEHELPRTRALCGPECSRRLSGCPVGDAAVASPARGAPRTAP